MLVFEGDLDEQVHGWSEVADGPIEPLVDCQPLKQLLGVDASGELVGVDCRDVPHLGRTLRDTIFVVHLKEGNVKMPACHLVKPLFTMVKREEVQALADVLDLAKVE